MLFSALSRFGHSEISHEALSVTRLLLGLLWLPCLVRKPVILGALVIAGIGSFDGIATPHPADSTEPTPNAPRLKPTARVSQRQSTNLYPWEPVFRGVDYVTTATDTPVPMKIHAVRVHLAAPGVKFLVTPSNGEQPLDTNGMRTSTFLQTHKCQVAINASPFSPIAHIDQTPQDVLGLSMSRGDRYSPGNRAYAALLITKNNKAWIDAPPVNANMAYNAVGGFHLLLKKGKNVGENDQRHPRTAAGISKDGQYLYLIVIDGRQKGYSEGATTAETAEWIRSFGAFDALNLDGGGSTAMAMANGRGGAKILNRPIHLRIPGMERVVANHLGVFAEPLDDSR